VLAEGSLDPRAPILEKADGTVTRFYSVKKDKGKALKEVIQKTFGVDVGMRAGALTTPRGSTDLMEVSGSRELVEHIHEALRMLEADQPQVEIEVRVVEVSSSRDTQIGVANALESIQGFDASGNPVLADKTFFRSNVARYDTADFLNSLTGNTPFQGSLLQLDGDHDDKTIDLLIEALVREGRAELLSAPRITVLHGHTATINVGQETPIFKGRALNRDTILVDVDFKQTGVSLGVTPYVLGRETVQLVVAPSISSVTGFTTASGSGGSFSNPIISTRNATTVVNVQNGSSFILGGLITKQKIEDVSKTPILGDIPLIGALFRTKRTRSADTQIVFIITPRIIHPGSSTDRVIIPPGARSAP
jgi:pilus assembly protein CpaC